MREGQKKQEKYGPAYLCAKHVEMKKLTIGQIFGRVTTEKCPNRERFAKSGNRTQPQNGHDVSRHTFALLCFLVLPLEKVMK